MAETDTTTASEPRVDWHALGSAEVLEQLGSRRRGLSPEVAQERLAEVGPNRLPEEPPVPAWRRFLRQFHNLLIYVLLVAAGVTAILGDWIETGVIAAVVLINALIGSIQEGRAERALAGLKSMLALQAVVLRGGVRCDVSAEDLVPGDVILVESGDRVAADVRLLEAHSLRAEEAMLTGESVPVEKRSAAVGSEASLGDRTSMLYAGTTIASGAGVGVVVATAGSTEVGRIGALVSGVIQLKTPFLSAIDHFSKLLAYAILVIGALLFGIGTFVRGYALDEIFLTVIGFAVAAIPEGLPAVITIILALGVQRMARRRAIVRRLPAVETLGAVTVICSDKTGTLTKNEMTVRRLVFAGELFEVAGDGYEPSGEVRDATGMARSEDAQLRELAFGAAVTAEAEFVDDPEKGRRLSGDPTDGAVVVLAEKLGISQHALQQVPRLGRIPFESELRYAATLTEGERGRVVYLKGAPERVIEMSSSECTAEGSSTPIDRSAWTEAARSLAAEAYRVLAVAVLRDAPEGDALSPEQVDSGLELLGLVAMIDPPRDEVKAAVAQAHEAGVRVVMITGDHELTARAIARELGIGDGERAVSGIDLEELDEAAMEQVAAEVDVFARASPEHKLRLLEALQRRGEVAAMTGDGVNDAPALKRADVGIAMGVKGSEAAKDASEMVLADDNFATITRAIAEGRTIYDNLKKTILFILPTNGAEALVVMVSVLVVLRELPITPVQILWINMVTAVTLALALAFEPSEANVMRRPPRNRSEPILSAYLLWRVVYVSLVMGALTLWAFFVLLEQTGDLALARSVAVNTLVAGEIAYLLSSRFMVAFPLAPRRLFTNPAVFVSIAVLLVLQLLFTYTPAMQLWFGVAPLGWGHWGVVLAAGLAVFAVVEFEKWVVRFRSSR
jgi:magnesium-transporting ATPase (P-type)